MKTRKQISGWNRDAGYTLASGSSSCAAVAVSYRLGLCKSNIVVLMPGGELNIQIDKNYQINMSDTVTRIYEGKIDPEIFGNTKKKVLKQLWQN